MPQACQGHDDLVRSAPNERSEDLAAVLRWQASGGTVRVLAWGPPVVLALITCDGGQEMQRITSAAADLAEHLRD